MCRFISQLWVYCIFCQVQWAGIATLFRDSLGWLVEFIAKFLQFQPEEEVFNYRRFDDVSTTVLRLEEDYNTVVETSVIKNFC